MRTGHWVASAERRLWLVHAQPHRQLLFAFRLAKAIPICQLVNTWAHPLLPLLPLLLLLVLLPLLPLLALRQPPELECVVANTHVMHVPDQSRAHGVRGPAR